ncbi:Mth938-like domain-containing protein [Parvibaculum sp.]|uniref:Mth938-like domain-containing protein n=1 Tax=Parvibaculum sp. TaxID=2024848 RepID=UPI0032114AE9
MKPRFAGQPLIDAYGDGGFRLNEQRFEGSILLTPRGLCPWAAGELGQATRASFATLVECIGEFDFLLVGSGAGFAQLPKEIRAFLADLRIMPDVMTTGAACRTYNVLRFEGRRVAAALIAVS